MPLHPQYFSTLVNDISIIGESMKSPYIAQFYSEFYLKRKFIGRLFSLFVFLGFSSITCQSQNEGTKWYFGAQAGLDFMTSPPTILTNGAMTTQEGCASIADAAGNLLFYTDGITIWNQSHLVMPNGSGLLGNGSTTQSGVIIKQPGNNTFYIVFTLDFQGNANGLRYSVVDMSLSSGTGSVTTKNVLLQTPSSEKLTAVRHCNGTDIWVVSHDLSSNNFRTFLVTSSGVNTSPVNSAVGPVHLNMLGYMKASTNGRKLGLAVYTTNNSFEIYDFDNSTGIVSNPIVLGSSFFLPYGCDFSPNGRYFYGCNATAQPNCVLYQWDLCAGSSTAIINSQTTIFTGSVSLAAMQLATNGKIYVGRYLQSTIGVINSPNSAGAACNYVDLGQSVSPKICRLGLPNFVTSFFKGPPNPFSYSFNSSLSCLNATFTAPASQTCGSMGYTTVSSAWNFGDPSSGASNTSFLSNPTHSFSAVGIYTVQLVTYYTCGSDTVRQVVAIPSPTLIISTTSVNCSAPGSATVFASGGPPALTYTWLPGNVTNSVISGVGAGTYTVQLSAPGAGCNYSATATIGAFNSFTPSVFSSTPTCIGANTATAGLVITGGTGPFSYTWTGLAQTTPTVTGLGSGTYTVFINDSTSNCILSQTFQISQPPALTLNIVASSPSVCLGGSISFTGTATGGTGTYTYNWTGGPNTGTNSVTETLPGNYVYTLTITDSNGCSLSDTISARYLPYPVLSSSSASICLNTSHTLIATGAANYTWMPGSIINSSMVVAPTVMTNYTVMGMSAGCYTSATVSIYIKPYPTFSFLSFSITCGSLGSATINSSGGLGPFTYTWTPTLSNGSIVNNLFPGNYTITSFDAGTSCFYNPTIYFAPLVPLTGTVVNSPSIACNGINTGSAAIILAGGSASQTYQWMDAIGTRTVAQPTDLAAGVNTVIVQDSLTYCTLTKTFVITQPSPLTLMITASSPSACLGSSVTLNGSAGGGVVGAGYTYTWSNGLNTTSFTSSENSAGTFQYTLSSLDGNNCLVTKTISLLFVINPTISVSSASICPLKQATLTASGANSFSWSTGQLGQVLQISPNQFTTYTVVGNSFGCTDTTIATVYLFASPIPTMTSNAPICQGQDLVITFSGGTLNLLSGPNNFTSSANSSTLSTAQPSQSGIYSLLVQSVFGCTAATSSSLTVYPSPLLVATAGTVCQGGNLHLSCNYLSGGTYTWSGTGFLANTQNCLIQNAQPNQSGTYTVIGTSAVGCTSTAFANASVSAQINAQIISDSIFCRGDSLNFYGAGGSLYFWNGPNSFYSTHQNPSLANASLSSSGQYTLVTQSGPCSSSAVKSITVFSAPSLTIAGNTVICENLNLSLTASGANTYTWFGPASFGTTQSNAVVTNLQASNAGVYYLKGTDSHQCVAIDSIVVNVLSAPLISAQNVTACLGGIATLTASSNGQINWSGPLGNMNTSTMVLIPAVSNTNIGTYIINAIGSNSCSSSASINLIAINVELPIAQITGSKKTCLGGTLSLTGSGGTEYFWSGPLGIVQTGTQFVLAVNSQSQAGTYTLVIRDSRGCQVSDTIGIGVFPLPRVKILKNPLSACMPYCANIQAQAIQNSAAITDVSYFLLNKEIGKGKLQYCFVKPGVFEINVNYKDSNSCVGNSILSYSVFEKPIADFYYNPTQPVAGLDEVYFYSSSNSSNLKSWSWFFERSDSVASVEKNAKHFFVKAGMYPIVEIVKNGWGCSDTIIKLLKVEDELALYVPNAFTPNADGINDLFQPKGEGIKKYHLLIFNRWGDLIFETQNFYEGWDGRFKGAMCQVDSYVWMIEYSAVDAKEVKITGKVLLTR